MLWLNNQNYNSDFFQIFIENNKVYDEDNNQIWSFESKKNDNQFELHKNSNVYTIDLDQLKTTDLTFEIKIIDQIISWSNIKTNETFVFSFKMNFINPTENEYCLPMFNFNYKTVNKTRMPNLISSNYNQHVILNFTIYKPNDNIQFIIETNPETNSKKKYIITNNLKNLDNFLTNLKKKN